MDTLNSKFNNEKGFTYYDMTPCDAEEISIEREWDSWRLKEDYLEIGKNIMDEFSNCYGLYEANMFNTGDNGNIEFSK